MAEFPFPFSFSEVERDYPVGNSGEMEGMGRETKSARRRERIQKKQDLKYEKIWKLKLKLDNGLIELEEFDRCVPKVSLADLQLDIPWRDKHFFKIASDEDVRRFNEFVASKCVEKDMSIREMLNCLGICNLSLEQKSFIGHEFKKLLRRENINKYIGDCPHQLDPDMSVVYPDKIKQGKFDVNVYKKKYIECVMKLLAFAIKTNVKKLKKYYDGINDKVTELYRYKKPFPVVCQSIYKDVISDSSFELGVSSDLVSIICDYI